MRFRGSATIVGVEYIVVLQPLNHAILLCIVLSVGFRSPQGSSQGLPRPTWRYFARNSIYLWIARTQCVVFFCLYERFAWNSCHEIQDVILLRINVVELPWFFRAEVINFTRVKLELQRGRSFVCLCTHLATKIVSVDKAS